MSPLPNARTKNTRARHSCSVFRGCAHLQSHSCEKTKRVCGDSTLSFSASSRTCTRAAETWRRARSARLRRRRQTEAPHRCPSQCQGCDGEREGARARRAAGGAGRGGRQAGNGELGGVGWGSLPEGGSGRSTGGGRGAEDNSRSSRIESSAVSGTHYTPDPPPARSHPHDRARGAHGRVSVRESLGRQKKVRPCRVAVVGFARSPSRDSASPLIRTALDCSCRWRLAAGGWRLVAGGVGGGGGGGKARLPCVRRRRDCGPRDVGAATAHHRWR
jgi:hypothetical protein